MSTTEWKKIWPGFCDGATVVRAWDGTVYQLASRSGVARIDRYDVAADAWRNVKTFDGADDLGKDGLGHWMLLNADGSALIGLASRDKAGDKTMYYRTIPGIHTPAPELPDELFRGAYGEHNADVMVDDKLGLRLERQRQPLRALLDWAFAVGLARRKRK